MRNADYRCWWNSNSYCWRSSHTLFLDNSGTEPGTPTESITGVVNNDLLTIPVDEITCQANQDLITVTQNDTEISIEIADGEVLTAYNPTNFPQGEEGEWVVLAIDTGVSDITKVTYNGVAFDADKVDEATTLGLPAGYFALWVNAAALPITFTLGVEGQVATKTFTVNLV